VGLRQLFNRRRLPGTIGVLILALLFIRLGFWQLDRLAQRKQLAEQTRMNLAAPPLVLSGENIPSDFTGMIYRHIIVSGYYDFDGEVVLRNQNWIDNNGVHHNGVHLLTPLRIAGSELAVLVDRGWIPVSLGDEANRSAFRQMGLVSVQGVLRAPQTKSQMGLVREPTLPPGETRRDKWNFANVRAIEEQAGYPLLDVYVQEEPTGLDAALPYTKKLAPDTSQGAHLGFAFQWFSLALIILIGYPIVVRKQETPTLGSEN